VLELFCALELLVAVELEAIVVGAVVVVVLDAASATEAPAIAPIAPSTASALSMRGRDMCDSFGLNTCGPVNGSGVKGRSGAAETRLGAFRGGGHRQFSAFP
jgi:hypothetical protein